MKRKRYQSYLLRIWRVIDSEYSNWLLSLENSHTGEKKGFADVEAMCEFIKDLLDATEGNPCNRSK